MVRSPSELELFHRYIGDKLSNGAKRMSLDEALKEFREYQQQLEKLRRELQPALECSRAGKAYPVTLAQMKARLKKELARRGIKG